MAALGVHKGLILAHQIDPLLLNLIDMVDRIDEPMAMKLIVCGCVLVGELIPSIQWHRLLARSYVDVADDEMTESRLLQIANAPIDGDMLPPSQRMDGMFLHFIASAADGPACWRIRADDVSAWAALGPSPDQSTAR